MTKLLLSTPADFDHFRASVAWPDPWSTLVPPTLYPCIVAYQLVDDLLLYEYVYVYRTDFEIC